MLAAAAVTCMSSVAVLSSTFVSWQHGMSQAQVMSTDTRQHCIQLKLATLSQEEDEASTSGVDDIPLEKKLGISVRVCFFLSLWNQS